MAQATTPTSDHELKRLASEYPSVDPTALSTSLAFLRLAADVGLALARHFERYGLSEGRFNMLMLLLPTYGNGGVTPSALAVRAGVTRGTITGLLDGLERDALVRREPHPKDRRSLTVHLTREGKLLMDEVLPDHLARLAGLTEMLPAAERANFDQALHEIRAALPVL